MLNKDTRMGRKDAIFWTVLIVAWIVWWVFS